MAKRQEKGTALLSLFGVGILVAMTTAATVIAAGVAFAVMIVMIAAHIGIETQGAGQQICNCSICVSAAAAVQSDTCLLECHLGTAADTAADQNICL